MSRYLEEWSVSPRSKLGGPSSSLRRSSDGCDVGAASRTLTS